LLRLIYDDAFLKKHHRNQIMPNGKKMLNRNFDYQIDFGRMINVERKLKITKLFQKQF
jgi:cell division protein FtsQ